MRYHVEMQDAKISYGFKQVDKGKIFSMKI